MPRGTVLVIDDEPDLLELVKYNLEAGGLRVLVARDGETGLAMALSGVPEVVLIDLMLPGIDGLEVCSRLRSDQRTSRVQIIMLTARASETDRVVGLELGADDYVTKPFSPRELVARVKSALRRSTSEVPLPELLRRGAISIDLACHRVMCGDTEVTLTATEYRLLQVLAARPGRVFSRNELLDGAFGRDVRVLERTVDVHMVSLRKKLQDCGRYVETVRGFGYRFREAQDE